MQSQKETRTKPPGMPQSDHQPVLVMDKGERLGPLAVDKRVKDGRLRWSQVKSSLTVVVKLLHSLQAQEGEGGGGREREGMKRVGL